MADTKTPESKIIADFVPLFVQSLNDKGRSPSTVLAYRSDIDQLLSFLYERNKTEIQTVRSVDLENFRDFLLAQKYTAKSTSRKLNAIKTFFRWLKDNKYVEKDPSRDVSHPKIEASVPQFLTEKEYRSLRDYVRGDVRISAMVELILQAGLRISEVANLKLEHIKVDRLTVESYATQPEREVPLTLPATAAIQMYMTARPQLPNAIHLFVSKNGKPLAVRNIRAAVDRYLQKAQMPHYSVNDLRTTFMVENLKRGVDLVLLSRVSGHKRLSTTERYLELAEIKASGNKQHLSEL